METYVHAVAPRPPRAVEAGRETPSPQGLQSELEAIRGLERSLEARRRDALSTIAQTYTPSLLRFCEGRLGNREAAEEVVQDVLTQVRGQLGRLEGSVHLRNLLFRLAKNRCAEIGEARRKEQRLRSSLERARAITTLPVEDDDNAEREALRAAISALPKLEDRILLTLSMDFNLPLKHIAHVLEITEGACKMRSHRARIKLRKILQKKTYA